MKIICIGRNYAAHAKEMSSSVPSEPVFFMKPDTALSRDNQDFYLPDFSREMHHEVEMVVRISKPGKNIEEKFAHKYYDLIGLGIDWTARDLQDACKKNGLPWEKAKAFDNSAPIGRLLHKEDFPDLKNISFSLDVNGETRQSGNTSGMIFSIDQIISYVSRFITLKTGDLIFTGTPEGVGPVKTGDELIGKIEGDEMFRIRVK